ncbi:MAG: lipoyl(octanoyl) transferase LipB [Chloroflexota bacterium]|nr:MAG: lipoyl(octanoyl) transferase LipB [Chloroflexota bacterium]
MHSLGLIPYQEAWDLQVRLANEIADGLRSPTLLLLEHPHTYTFGRGGDLKHLLWDETTLEEKGIEVHWVDRGGDVTYHGPGQLVGYPLLPLGTPDTQSAQQKGKGHLPQVDYIEYLRKLETALIVALAKMGVTGQQFPGLTGVWIHLPPPKSNSQGTLMASLHPSKIASIGVKVDAHGISRHGFSLNVNPDMSYWDGIVACGLEDYPGISLANLISPLPSQQTVLESVVAGFGEVFNFSMQEKAI